MASNRTVHAASDRPTAELIGDATEQLTRLVRDEMRLAAAELQQKGKRIGVGAGLFGGASVLAFYGGLALLAGAILALSLVVVPWLAAILVGVAVLLVAAVLALVGKGQVQRATPPLPEATVRNVKADIQAAKEGMQR
jgi:membrane protein